MVFLTGQIALKKYMQNRYPVLGGNKDIGISHKKKKIKDLSCSHILIRKTYQNNPTNECTKELG